MGKGVLPELLDAADEVELDHWRLGMLGENASERAEDVLMVAERWRVMLMSRAGRLHPARTWSERAPFLLESQRPWLPGVGGETADCECVEAYVYGLPDEPVSARVGMRSGAIVEAEREDSWPASPANRGPCPNGCPGPYSETVAYPVAVCESR